MTAFRKFVGSPWTPTVLTALVVVMSLSGGKHLLVAVACGALLIGLTFLKESFERQEKNNLLRSWPTKRLWGALDDSYRSLRKADSAALQSPGAYREDGRNEAVREALRALVRLTLAFDESDATRRVGSNIMLYRTRESIVAAGEADAVQKRLKPQSERLETLAGVLDLQLPLSTCAADAATPQTPDPDLKPLALAVPTDWLSRQNDKLVIPGAAEAYVVPNGYLITDDTLTLAQERDGYSLPPHVWDEIDDYYRNAASPGRNVRSAVSIVITDPLKTPGAGDRLAVVNIHSDQPNLFKDENAFIAFKNFLAPILMDIGELLR